MNIKVIMISMMVLSQSRAAELGSFKPGELWLDNNGVHINAHGGGVLFHEGIYYWFGEHKIEGKAGNRAHVGVHVYSSTDLYNWTDAGIALEVSEDLESEIAKGCVLERPKVIHNAKTGKFVMWFHLEYLGMGYSSARSGVAVADAPAGPYTFVKSFRPNAGHWPKNAAAEVREIPAPETLGEVPSGGPNLVTVKDNILGRDFEDGQMARDQTLFVDDDGRAYHLHASEENSTLHISLLTDDYLAPSGTYVRVFPKRWMEAPAICKHDGKYYLIASGCTGWAPNAARGAVAEHIFGPWLEFGNPCVGVNPQSGMGPDKTFGGQSTFILPVQGQPGAFIAMFDMWCPDNAIDGRYLWLPIQFADDRFSIPWKSDWNLSFFQAGQKQ